jgi:hypothetical protein
MGDDLTTTTELAKLARALGTNLDGVTFARPLDPESIRQLRKRVSAALYDEHRAAFQRVATITRLLPTPVNVRITLRAFSPLLAARVAGEMAPDRAAELANRMPVKYLAEACLHLDPRRAAPLMSRVQPDRLVAIVVELVGRGEYITLGRLLDVAPEPVIGEVAATVCNEALLRIGYYTESNAQLTRAVALLPPRRLRDIVHTALTGPPDLRLTGLALIGRIEDDRLRRNLADYAAEADDDTLVKLLHTAVEYGAVAEMLAAVVAMSQHAQFRVLAVPALADPHVLARLRRATGPDRDIPEPP